MPGSSIRAERSSFIPKKTQGTISTLESLEDKRAKNINDFIHMNMLNRANYRSQKPLKQATSIPLLGKTHSNGFK